MGQSAHSVWTVAIEHGGVVDCHSLRLTDENSDPSSQAEAIAAEMRAHGYRGRGVGGVMVVPPADACLAASIHIDDLPRADRRETMLYRFEERLPVAAESVAADFIAETMTAFGVALECAAWRPIVESLETAGVNVAAICPACLIDWSARRAAGTHTACDGWLWVGGDRLELLLADDGVPAAWHAMNVGSPNLRRILAQWSNSRAQPPLLSVHDPDHRLTSALSPLTEVIRSEEASDESSLLEAAARASRAILTGRLDAPNLRRDGLAPADPWRSIRPSLHAAAACLAALLIVLTLALQWRSHRLEAQTSDMDARQAAAFERAFPGQRIPVAIRSRLESERMRLDGVSGADQQLPKRPSGLALLREVLRRLPGGDKTRYRILELAIDADRVDLEGEALTFSDADAVAAALRTQGGFDVEPPQTEQLRDEGVRFQVRASVGGLQTSTSQNAANSEIEKGGVVAARSAP